MARDHKTDWQEIRECLSKHHISCFYHYTALANLPHVIRHQGLLSRAQMRTTGLKPTRYHSWGAKRRELENYVCLAVNLPLGMLREEREPQIVLIVEPQVAWRSDTLFCPMNTARRELNPDELFSRFDLAALEALFEDPTSPRTRDYGAEILVRGHIHLREIRSVLFASGSDRRQARLLCWRPFLAGVLSGQIKWPKFRVDRHGLIFKRQERRDI